MKHIQQSWTIALLFLIVMVGSILLGGWQINNGGGGGSGTVSSGSTNVLAKYTGSTTVGNSSITDNGTSIATSEWFDNSAATTSGAACSTFVNGLKIAGSNTGFQSLGANTIDVCANNVRAAQFNSGGLLIEPAGGAIESPTFLTNTNCAAVGTAANPSVASCSASAAGSFSCATNASTGTCVVNTTAVTANSEIQVTQRADTTTGTRLSVTCNTTVSTVLPIITAVTAGTSFTINLGTVTTNPECFSYFIVN